MNLLESDNLFDPVMRAIEGILPQLPSILLGFLIGVVLVKLGTWLAEILVSMARLPKGLKSILVSLIHALFWVSLIIVTLNSLHLGNIALIFSGSLAAVGLAIAAGASSLAADILAGIFLSQDKDFNVGDEVIAGEKPTQGIIESMDMRRTRIRSKDGQLHVIPNSIVERKEWVVVKEKGDR